MSLQYEASPSINRGRDVTGVLASHGINLTDIRPGQHYTTCPNCSGPQAGQPEQARPGREDRRQGCLLPPTL